MPAATHLEKDGSFTNTQRLLQWHFKAVEPKERLPLRALVLLPPRQEDQGAARRTRRTRATCRSSTSRGAIRRSGEIEEPSAEAVLAEINGWDSTRAGARRLQAAEGGRLDRVRLLDLLRRLRGRTTTRRRARSRTGSRATPRSNGAGRGRRTGASSTTAPRRSRTASRGRSASSSSGGTASRRSGRATTRRTSTRRRSPTTCPPDDAKGPEAIRGDHPFIMQADGLRLDLRRRRALVDGPLPTHYEPHESPFQNPLYAQRANPAPADEPRPRGGPVQPARARDGLSVRPHHLPADRAPHRGRHVTVHAVPRRAAAADVRRGASRSRARARARRTAAGRRSRPRARRSRRA